MTPEYSSASPLPKLEMQTIFVLSGVCRHLSVPDSGESDCANHVLHMIYRGGRQSFAFSSDKNLLISFSGSAEVTSLNVDTLTVDHVTVANGRNNEVAEYAAAGFCILTAPQRSYFDLKCEARAGHGHYQGVFRSDGKVAIRHDF